MSLVPDVRDLVRRAGVTVQNAVEVARFGGFVTDDVSTPYTVVATVGIAELRRYGSDLRDRLRDHEDGEAAVGVDAVGPPIVLLPPLMMTAEVWDVSPSTSAVRRMLDDGLDPWVIDFGSPEDVAGGLSRTLTDHVVAVAGAIEEIRERTGQDVHVAGYSQGGMFAYQAAAFRRTDGVASVITFGSPVDVHSGVPFGLPQAEITQFVARLVGSVFGSSAVPGWLTRTGFKLLDPVKTVRSRLDFLMQLHDRERLLEREPQRRFLDGEGFIAWPGPALADFASQFIAHNRMLAGGFVIEGRLVTLADITCPVLIVVGESDDIAPPSTVRSIEGAAPDAQVRELAVPTGHFGLVVGSRASSVTWPAVSAWVNTVADGAELDEHDAPWSHVDHQASGDATFGPTPSGSVQLLLDAGSTAVRSSLRMAQQGVRTATGLADGALELLPRILRLERVNRDTRVSLALLLDERAERAPDGIFFLHQDRAYSWSVAKGRIDAVVRGLLHLGVRQGEHVGVLMPTRPSALALVAALNRIGAVVVLLRPDGELATELELGQVRRLITDPDHVDDVRGVVDVPIAVLGGGGEDRDLGPGVVDMERIDPEQVELPRWYRPNPGRAGELGFLLFTGRGERTRANRILNGRWALSAFGTASAARLSDRDTMYGATPVFHPSGLLTAIGGAVAGSARLALVPVIDGESFWSGARRAGATVVSYTWNSMREPLAARPEVGDSHGAIRLFVGSGMPVGLWRRVLREVPSAQVLEFYASTEGGVVLANVSGDKIGSKGRRLPGSVRTALAAWDLDADRLDVGEDGFARACAPGEPGMLLAAADRDVAAGRTTALRGVFHRGDAWLPTGDLLWQDGDGDHWLLGSTSSMIRTARGVVAPVPIEDRLGLLDVVDLVTVYRVPTDDPTQHLAVAAVTLRGDAPLDAGDVTHLFSGQPPERRPDAVRVVDTIPLTAWFRIDDSDLRAAGLPRHRRAAPVLRWVPDDDCYRPR